MQTGNFSDILARLAQVRARIEEVSRACGRRADDIRLLAVSKTHAAEAIRLVAHAGQREFGENQLQEALPKIAELSDLALIWHFIGPVQANKTRGIAEHFHWVHSLDSRKIAERLNRQRPAELPPLQVCIQVNSSGEHSKSGVADSELLPLTQCIAELPRLQLRGVMAIPQPSMDVIAQLQSCLEVRAIYERLRAAGFALDTLSLGMSADLEAAVQAGSTMLRIGTDIFGVRNTSDG